MFGICQDSSIWTLISSSIFAFFFEKQYFCTPVSTDYQRDLKECLWKESKKTKNVWEFKSGFSPNEQHGFKNCL